MPYIGESAPNLKIQGPRKEKLVYTNVGPKPNVREMPSRKSKSRLAKGMQEIIEHCQNECLEIEEPVTFKSKFRGSVMDSNGTNTGKQSRNGIVKPNKYFTQKKLYSRKLMQDFSFKLPKI